MPSFFITGVAGFIGNHIARFLLQSGYRVIGIDNFSTGFEHNISDLKNLEFIQGDINNTSLYASVLKECTHCIHQAALPSVPRSMKNPLATHEANVSGTLSLLETIRQTQSVERFVFASSSSVYGSQANTLRDEDQTCKPMSPYAMSKYMTELWAYHYQEICGLECIGLRYFNVFGPKQNPYGEYAAVIPKFILASLKNDIIHVYGNGEQSRDFTFIDNVVHANFLASIADSKFTKKSYNIGTNQQTTILDLIQTIGSFSENSTMRIEFLPKRSGDILYSCANINLAKQNLNYNPFVSFQDGILKTIQYYKQSEYAFTQQIKVV